MSFGFSITDITLLINGLVTVADLIKGEAAHEFQSLSGLFHQYASFAHRLQDCYETGYFLGFAKESLDRMNSTLHRFFARFEYLDPYLGINRSRNRFLRALQAIRWSSHRRVLMGFRKDFESQLNLLSTEFTFFSGGPVRVMKINTPYNMPLPQWMHAKSFFVLEDACRQSHFLHFWWISNWDDLHELLLRTFTEEDSKWNLRGRQLQVIEARQYVLRVNLTNILPSSPCLGDFRDLVKDEQTVRMSAIFPCRSSYVKKCPNCRRKRDKSLREVSEQTCTGCGLWICLQESQTNEPGPLTQLCLNDIKACGLGKLSTRLCHPTGTRGAAPAQASASTFTMKKVDAWLSAINARTAGQPCSQVERDPPDIKDFGCVTCCDAQWPDLGKHTAYKMRFKSFSNLLKRVGSTVKEGEVFNWDPVQYLSTRLRSGSFDGNP